MSLFNKASQTNCKLQLIQGVLLFIPIIFLVIAFIYPGKAYSESIAQINIQQGSSVDSVYIKLLERDAPLTVQNFRNYMIDGDYSNSFFHLSTVEFLQGGGFTFDPTLNDGSFSYDAGNDVYPGGLQKIPGDEPIVNEFDIDNSNLPGTLAMEKLGSDPDSATSQWFVNLGDNSFLDALNGGYTVFAEVLGNGMDILTGVASQDVHDRSDIHPDFGAIPLVGFLADPVIDSNLVRINSITEVLSISPDISYGTVTPDTNLQPEVVLVNTGTNSVLIGDIGGLNPLLAPFIVVTDLCTNIVLSPGQRCSFIALFSPTTSGDFDDSFDIELPELGINYEIKLSGAGGSGSVADEADFSSTYSSLDFGLKEVLLNPEDLPYIKSTTIRNFGGIDLLLNTIALSQDSDIAFSLSNEAFTNSDNCTAISVLAPNQSCILEVLYRPLVDGDYTAKLIIESDDPDEGLFEIPIFASALTGTDADISSTYSSLDYGLKEVLFNPEDLSYIKSTTITNSGGIDLLLNTIALSQDSDIVFSLGSEALTNSDNCMAISVLAPNQSCIINVLYRPLVDGDYTAKLIIESDDPDEGLFEIPIFASALSDSDGVDTTVEDAEPNNGDGNSDDIIDSRQSNVVSIPDLLGTYNTYLTDKKLNQFFYDVRIVEQDLTEANPDNVILQAGVHEFTFYNVAANAIVEVGLLLPAGVDPTEYYVYGPTLDDSTPHWYKFDNEGDTGTSFIGVAKFTSPSGDTIDRNVIFLRIKNGGRGDSSNVQDNSIVVKAGINYSSRNNDSSGFLSFIFLQMIFLTLVFLRVSR